MYVRNSFYQKAKFESKTWLKVVTNEKIRPNLNLNCPSDNHRACIHKMIQHIFRIKETDQHFWMNDDGNVVFKDGDKETVIQSGDAKTVFNRLLVQMEMFEAEQREKNSLKNRIVRKLFKRQ